MALTYVPVHFEVQNPSTGDPAAGIVSVEVPEPIRDAGGEILYFAGLPTRQTATLVAGEATIAQVPATDDADVVSAGFVRVTVELVDASGAPMWRESRDIAIPSATVGTLEYATASQVVSASAVVSYATSAALAAAVAQIDAETAARIAADALRLLLAGGTITGNLTIQDAAIQTKAYRFRTNGGSLDNEAAGQDWYISVWSTAGFAGTQRTYLRLEAGSALAHAIGRWVFASGPFGGTVLDVDGAAGTLGFFGTAAAAKPTITGSRGSNAALASLLTGLAGLGLLTDSTTT